MWTVVHTTEEQREKITNKYLVQKKGMFGTSNKPTNVKYSCDTEDDIGFISFDVEDSHFSYQFRRKDVPCFVEFNKNGSNIRYDTSYPEGVMYDRLRYIAKEAHDNFWAGGAI